MDYIIFDFLVASFVQISNFLCYILELQAPGK